MNKQAKNLPDTFAEAYQTSTIDFAFLVFVSLCVIASFALVIVALLS